MRTLCVLLDRRSARPAINAALDRSRGGDTLVVSAYKPSVWGTEPAAVLAGIVPVDPATAAADEVRHVARDTPRPPSSAWIGDRERLPSYVRALLGEFRFRAVVIGSRREDDLCLHLLREARRYTVAEVVAR